MVGNIRAVAQWESVRGGRGDAARNGPERGHDLRREDRADTHVPHRGAGEPLPAVQGKYITINLG